MERPQGSGLKTGSSFPSFFQASHGDIVTSPALGRVPSGSPTRLTGGSRGGASMKAASFW